MSVGLRCLFLLPPSLGQGASAFPACLWLGPGRCTDSRPCKGQGTALWCPRPRSRSPVDRSGRSVPRGLARSSRPTRLPTTPLAGTRRKGRVVPVPRGGTPTGTLLSCYCSANKQGGGRLVNQHLNLPGASAARAAAAAKQAYTAAAPAGPARRSGSPGLLWHGSTAGVAGLDLQPYILRSLTCLVSGRPDVGLQLERKRLRPVKQ